MPDLPTTDSILSTITRTAAGVVLYIVASSLCIAQTNEIDTPDARDAALTTEIERVLQLLGANDSVAALEQAPNIRRLIRREERQGNAETAWDLEQALLAVAEHYRDDPRSARILEDAADKRLRVLARFEAGEFPAEIVLGCYFDASATFDEGWAQSSRAPDAASASFADETGSPFDVPFGKPATTCANGSQSRAREAILLEAQSFYADAFNILVRAGESAGYELPDLVRKLDEVAYRRQDYASGRQGLEILLAYQTRESADVVAQIDTMLELGDWYLVWVPQLGKKLEEPATSAYLDAYALAGEHGLAQSLIDEIFPSDVPVVLPTFLPNPLISPETAASAGFIDLAFVVTRDGRSRDISVLDSTTNATRGAQRDLERMVRRSRFRPVVSAEGIVDEAPMTIRYYVNE